MMKETATEEDRWLEQDVVLRLTDFVLARRPVP